VDVLDESDEDRATTMKVIQVSKPVPADRILDRSTYNETCYFPFPMSEVRLASQIVSINFGIFVRRVPPQPEPPRPTFILIYMLLSASGDRRLLRKKRIVLNSQETGQWYHFRLNTEDIQHWVNQPGSNYGLFVQSPDMPGSAGMPIAVVTPRSEIEEPFRPYIEVETNDQSVSRSKRTTDMNCDERSAERRCCRYPLIVDFDAFQWDWVIVPKRYSAFYCSGECPYLFVQQHGHSHINQQLRPSGSGGPCCSPRKLSAISMLYYDEHMNIVLGRLPNMVVDRCGCS
jgi:hypothetical protein